MQVPNVEMVTLANIILFWLDKLETLLLSISDNFMYDFSSCS